MKLKRSPLSTTDKYANEFQRKYDDVRHRFEVYGSVSGLKHRWSDHDFDEMQQWVEAWLCREMYHTIFPHSAHGINKQDFLQDEQLQAKIAALNFLDLTLEHLGFVLEHPEDVKHIAQVVREGGVGKDASLLLRCVMKRLFLWVLAISLTNSRFFIIFPCPIVSRDAKIGDCQVTL